jgi:hypothetical protein
MCVCICICIQVLEENRILEAAFQNYRRESESHLLQAQQAGECVFGGRVLMNVGVCVCACVGR